MHILFSSLRSTLEGSLSTRGPFLAQFYASPAQWSWLLLVPKVLSGLESIIVVVQSLSHVWLFVTPWTAAHRASCPSPSPWVCSNSCPFSGWCHPTISSLLPPSPPALSLSIASGSFSMNRLFASGGQGFGASASASVLPMNIQGWFPLGLTVLISLLSEGLLKSLLQHNIQKHQCLHEGRICDISCISSPWILYIFPSFPGKIPKLGRIFPTFVGPNPHPGSAGVLESLGSLHPNQLPDNLCTCPVPTGCPEPGTHTHHLGLWRTGEPGSPGYARALVLHTLS